MATTNIGGIAERNELNGSAELLQNDTTAIAATIVAGRKITQIPIKTTGVIRVVDNSPNRGAKLSRLLS